LRPGGHAGESQVGERRRRTLRRRCRHAVVLRGRRPATVGHHIDAERFGRRRRSRSRGRTATVVLRIGELLLRSNYSIRKKTRPLHNSS